MKATTRQSLAIFVIFLTGILANGFQIMPVPDDESLAVRSLPPEIDGWSSFEVELGERILEAVNADQTLLRTYKKSADEVTIYIGYHSSSKGGRPAHLPSACLPSSGWHILSSEVEQLPVSLSAELPRCFNRMVISKDDEEQLVRYWFQSEDKIMATGWDLNTFRIISRLKRQPYGTAFVRLSTPVHNGDLGAATELLDLWTERAARFLMEQA
jgi:EpsI family protein